MRNADILLSVIEWSSDPDENIDLQLPQTIFVGSSNNLLLAKRTQDAVSCTYGPALRQGLSDKIRR